MRYKLCSLDQGGLLTNTGEIPSRAVWKVYGIDERIAMEIWKQHDEEFFGGRISEDHWWNYFSEKASNRVPLKEVKRIFRENFEPYLDNLIFVGKLASQKLGTEDETMVTAIWTNNSREWLDFQKKKFNLHHYVDLIISSHELGITKHNPRYFDLALEEAIKRYGYNFLKKDVVFFDDDLRYCHNAENAGIKSVHVPRPEMLPDLIRKNFQVSI